MVYFLSPPPSSSGPGRSPLKAKTGVRVPLGALKRTCPEQLSTPEQFMELVRFDQRGLLNELPVKLEKVDVRFK